jgi:phage major head subunit gpT-like protein
MPIGTAGLLTPSDLEVFFLGLDASWSQVYETTPTWYNRLAMVRPSATSAERYGWADRIPTLREWVGPRVSHGMQTETLFVENKPFELTLEVDKFRLMDDQHGLYSNLAAQMGWQSAKWPDQQLAAAVNANISGTDGLPFFSTNHPIDLYAPSKGVFANTWDKGLDPDGFAFVRSKMMTQVAQDGQPLNIIPDVLIVPPALEYAARSILNTSFIAPVTIGGIATGGGSVDNILKGMCDVLVIPELAAGSTLILNGQVVQGSDTAWYMADTRMPVKALTWQLRQAPQIVARVNPQDPKVFEQHVFVYGVEARGAPVLTFPFLMHRSDPTLGG